VRGRSDLAAAFVTMFVTWPATGGAVKAINPSAIPAALAAEMNRFGIFLTFSIMG
jgi:hypothetical protein